jgi:cell division septation protein DedD
VQTAAAKPPAKSETKSRLVKAPPPKIADTEPARALAATAPNGKWRIQLGAFSQRGNAEALYRKLSANGVLAGRRPFYVAVGPVTRLQIGPFESKNAAETACKALGVPCFPIAIASAD